MKARTSPKAPRIIEQHEYISVDFGNGRRLTTSYSGQRAAGAIPPHVWRAWLAAMDEKNTGLNYGERVRAFAAGIDALWPEWGTPPKEFAVGQAVKFDFGPRRGGADKGVVVKKVRATYTVRFERMGLVGIPADLLAEYNGGAS
jgi:hypothetical protein